VDLDTFGNLLAQPDNIGASRGGWLADEVCSFLIELRSAA
jgi:hypothetical protein